MGTPAGRYEDACRTSQTQPHLRHQQHGESNAPAQQHPRHAAPRECRTCSGASEYPAAMSAMMPPMAVPANTANQETTSLPTLPMRVTAVAASTIAHARAFTPGSPSSHNDADVPHAHIHCATMNCSSARVAVFRNDGSRLRPARFQSSAQWYAQSYKLIT